MAYSIKEKLNRVDIEELQTEVYNLKGKVDTGPLVYWDQILQYLRNCTYLKRRLKKRVKIVVDNTRFILLITKLDVSLGWMDSASIGHDAILGIDTGSQHLVLYDGVYLYDVNDMTYGWDKNITYKQSDVLTDTEWSMYIDAVNRYLAL